MLYRLQLGDVVTTTPTIGFNLETITYNNLTFQVWDLGGQTSIRPYWRCYYSSTDVVIFVVDSTDRDRVALAKQELYGLLDEAELKETVLVVMANKQDAEGAMTEAEIMSALGLSGITTQQWAIFMTSALKGDGIFEAMDWIAAVLKSRGKA